MLLISYGTRPEWLKIKPLIDIFSQKSVPFKILFTGQHTTLINEKFDIKIDITPNENRLDSIFLSILGNNKIFEHVDRVLVQGDTASAFAVALAAFHRNIEIVHLEAGLRTYDINNPYPEESYRRCISNIASIHLCPTVYNMRNLENEGVNGKIYITGNTLIDSLLQYKNDVIINKNICLITLHRNENRKIINKWLKAINEIAKLYKNFQFLFIRHPSMKFNIKNMEPNIIFNNPLPHNELLNIIIKCKFIISDSGGIQEEASFFNKPIIVCRKVTERPESLNTTSFLCTTPSYLQKIIKLSNFNDFPKNKCPFGDGHSAEKIYKLLYE